MGRLLRDYTRHSRQREHEIVRSLRRRRGARSALAKKHAVQIALLVPCAHDFGLGSASPAEETLYEVPTRTNGITI